MLARRIRRQRVTVRVVATVVVLAAVVASCSDGTDGATTSRPPGATGVGADGATPATIAPDIDQAGPDAVLLDDSEPRTLLQGVDEAMTLSYLQRRFGDLVDLSWADPLVDDATEALDHDSEGQELAFVGRFFDRDASPPPSLDQTLTGGEQEVDTDAIVAYSLWCDQVDLPDGYLDVLRSTSEIGGYELTHALGGAQLMRENDCLDDDEGARLVDELAVPTAELLATDSPADLELEACAILAWTGRWDLIPEDFAERVADAQLADGGWPLTAGDPQSDRHATVWGLRCALELEFGAEVGPARWIPA